MTHETLRFSELRAEGVESNLFQYHLRHVIRKGSVEKSGERYQLAPAGLYYADRFSPVYKGERPQPKIITIAVVKARDGRVLLLKKPRQPWLGSYHLPAGKIHTGETTGQAAIRELTEKAGIHVDEMEFRSLTHVQIYKGGELVSDYFGFIFSCQYDGDIVGGIWYDATTAQLDTTELEPGVGAILGFERLGDGEFHPVRIDVDE
ncbi:MAG: NUDIX domain-containing protein [Candidatus Saccharimonas sp.]